MNIAGIPVPIPTSVGGVIGLLIDALLTFAIIVLIDKIIAHEMELKHALIMALVAYFITPIMMFALVAVIPGTMSFVILGFIVPLLIWVLLGELLLHGDFGTKLKVAVVAFVVYFILTYAGIPGMIASMIPV